jgi:hypothetical protein
MAGGTGRFMKLLITLASLGAVLALPAAGQLLRLNARLKRENRVIRTVLIFPAEVSLSRNGMKGSEPASAEADTVAEVLYEAVSRELDVRGVKVLPNPAAGQLTDEAKYSLASMQLRYDTTAVQLSRKPSGVEKGRYTLGDAVAAFPPAAAAEALLFVRGSGTLLTNNKQAFRWALMSPALSEFAFRATFVDARSGEVLAFAKRLFLTNILNKSGDEIGRGIGDSFRGLPLPMTGVPTR